MYIGLLRRDTIYSGKNQPTFNRKQLTQMSTLKYASITFSENLGNYQTKRYQASRSYLYQDIY